MDVGPASIPLADDKVQYSYRIEVFDAQGRHSGTLSSKDTLSVAEIMEVVLALRKQDPSRQKFMIQIEQVVQVQ